MKILVNVILRLDGHGAINVAAPTKADAEIVLRAALRAVPNALHGGARREPGYYSVDIIFDSVGPRSIDALRAMATHFVELPASATAVDMMRASGHFMRDVSEATADARNAADKKKLAVSVTKQAAARRPESREIDPRDWPDAMGRIDARRRRVPSM